MVEIIAKKEGGSYETLDLFKDESITFNFSASESDDIVGRQGSQSLSFHVPHTDVNNRFFGHWYESAISGASFNARNKAECIVLEEGQTLVAGYLRLISVTDESYAIAIHSGAADLFTELEGKSLSSAFHSNFNDYDYTLTPQTVISSLERQSDDDITMGSVRTSFYADKQSYTPKTPIRIPIHDWAPFVTGEDKTIIHTFAGYDHNIGGDLVPVGASKSGVLSANHLKPAISVPHVIEKICDESGFEIESDFLNSDYAQHLYMQLGTERDSVGPITQDLPDVTIGMSGVDVITQSEHDNFAGGASFSLHKIPLSLETGGQLTDLGQQWDHVNHEFVCQFDGIELVDVPVQALIRILPNETMSGVLFAFSSVQGIIPITSFSDPIYDSSDTSTINNCVVKGTFSTGPMVLGETIYIGIYVSEMTTTLGAVVADRATNLLFQGTGLPNDPPHNVTNSGILIPIQSDSFGNCTNIHITDDNISVGGVEATTGIGRILDGNFNDDGSFNELESMFPEMTQKEFMKAMVDAFSLVIESDPENPSKLYIEPYDTWMTQGTLIDLDQRVERSEDITLLPTHRMQAKTIKSKMAEGKDPSNTYWKQNKPDNFGDLVSSIEDDFAEQDIDKELPFKAFHVSPVKTRDHGVWASYGDTPVLQDPTTSSALDEQLSLPQLMSRQYQFDGDDLGANGTIKRGSDAPFLMHFANDITVNPVVDGSGGNLPFKIGALDIHESSTKLGQFLPFSIYNPLPNSSADIDDVDFVLTCLNFDYDYPFAFTEAGGRYHSSLHSTFHAPRLANLNSSDARILECSVYFEPHQIASLRMNNLYTIDGSEWILQSVNGYEVGSDKPSRCVFVKAVARREFNDVYDNCVSGDVQDDGVLVLSDALTSEIGTIRKVLLRTGEGTEADPYSYEDVGENCCDSYQTWFADEWAAGGQDPARNPFTFVHSDELGCHSKLRKIKSEEDGTVNVFGKRIVVLEEQASQVEDRCYDSSTSVGGGRTTQAVRIPVPFGSIAKVQIEAASYQTTFDDVNGSIGSSVNTSYRVVAKNLAGNESSTIQEDIDGRMADSDSTTNRQITVRSEGGYLYIDITGETYATVDYDISACVTYRNFSQTLFSLDGLLYEDGILITTENQHILREE